MKPFTILHISDIHRGPHTDLNNLYESLITDSLECEKNGILKPSIIVVSGDIVEGAEGENAEQAVKQQYEEAAEFLTRLADYFLQKDKNRLIIVPGNHDMFRGMSEASMVPYKLLADDNPKVLRRNPMIRWSWKDLKFYKIAHEDIYAKRFDLFVEFYNTFYAGIRTINGSPETSSDIVDLENYGISFVLFNSCYRLDHLRYSGEIYVNAVSGQASRLRQLSRDGRLIVGVWHHHTQGLPDEENYMDYRILPSMVHNGIQVGLFGHQHFSQIINHYTSVDEDKEMLLISSGSLYGGRNQLVSGCSRQYNIIGVNIQGENATITVNVRTDRQPDFDIPNWTTCPIGKNNQERYEHVIKVEQPSNDEQLLELVETAKASGDYESALRKLYRQFKDNPRYNMLVDSMLPKVKMSPDELISILQHPRSETQAIIVLDALGKCRDMDKVNAILHDSYLVNSDSTIVKDLRQRLISKFNIG
jgi:DNA repair exonuclease SbcCD nuclease subunit